MAQINVSTVPVQIVTARRGSMLICNNSAAIVYFANGADVTVSGATQGVPIQVAGDTGWFLTSGYPIWVVAAAPVTITVVRA